jgi:hypothetical protein
MGRKTNDQIIDDRVERALKVKDLIKFLKNVPEDTVVGTVGHFGELYECDKYDVSIAECYVTPEGWRSHHRREIKIVNINTPDIGPDPD